MTRYIPDRAAAAGPIRDLTGHMHARSARSNHVKAYHRIWPGAHQDLTGLRMGMPVMSHGHAYKFGEGPRRDSQGQYWAKLVWNTIGWSCACLHKFCTWFRRAILGRACLAMPVWDWRGGDSRWHPSRGWHAKRGGQTIASLLTAHSASHHGLGVPCPW